MFTPFLNGPDLSPYVGAVVLAAIVVAAAAIILAVVIALTGGFRDKGRDNR